MNSQNSCLQAEEPDEKLSPTVARHSSWIGRTTRTLLLGVGLHVATNVAIEAEREMTGNNLVYAQPNLRETEAQRLFNEGNVAFGRGDYLTARARFLNSERIEGILHPGVTSIEMNWNIAACDIRLSGFDLILPNASASDARVLNARNEARLETVLGFPTIAQIRPVRDNLVDARNRINSLLSRYQRQLEQMNAPANSRERRELEINIRVAREALQLVVERMLVRIEPRYHELESVASGNNGNHSIDGQGQGDGRISVVNGREVIESRENVWFTTPRAVTLATGITGLLASGVGLVGYLLNNSDGQANLAQCRELQSRMTPCPLSLQNEFQGNSDRANAFGIAAWAGVGVAAVSTVLFLTLPSEARVTRESHPTSSSGPHASTLHNLTVTPLVSSAGTAGIVVGGRF